MLAFVSISGFVIASWLSANSFFAVAPLLSASSADQPRAQAQHLQAIEKANCPQYSAMIEDQEYLAMIEGQ